MEIEGEDGTKLLLNPGVKNEFGRGAGFKTEDLTVSRRHVSLDFKPTAAGTEQSESDSVSFEVLGRNPVWVSSGEKIQTFRKSETGEIVAGDRICVSGHLPIWFTLKRRDEIMEESALDDESELNLSDIDPVKEFGFLVIGKEFDQYPKSRMCGVKQWEWFLEDFTNGNSDEDDDDDDDGDKKRRKGLSKKRRRKKGNEEDDDWSVESEEDKELIVKSKRVVNPTYSTRSKKSKNDTNASTSSGGSAQTKQRGGGRVDDDDDETLGGFIVSDEEDKLEEEEESNVDDEEEEEEEEEDDDFDEE